MCWIAIGGVEHADQGALAQPAEGREEHVLALPIDVVGLLQEDALVGDAFVEGPGVLGKAERRVGADSFRQVHRVVERVRHRHRRLLGIDVDGRHVHREVIVHLDHEQARNPRDRDARCRPEPQRDPVAQVSRRQRYARAAGVDLHLLPGPIEHDAAAVTLSGRASAANGFSGPSTAVSMRSCWMVTGDPDSPLLEVLDGRTRREQEEGPLRAEQVGHGHGAQLRAVEPIRWKRDRHAQDRAPDAVLAEHDPERLRLAQQAQLGPLRAGCGSGRA